MSIKLREQDGYQAIKLDVEIGELSSYFELNVYCTLTPLLIYRSGVLVVGR